MTHDPLARTAETIEVRPLDQRTDRIRLACDGLYEDIGKLTYKLAPVLPDGELAADGDDQPADPQPDTHLARSLQLLAEHVEHLAAKVRAITAAVDL